MSYDLKIYTTQKQDYNLLVNQFNMIENEECLILIHKDYQIVISREAVLNDEDIPQHIYNQLPGIRFLIECSLEPGIAEVKKIEELYKVAKVLAKNGIGLIEDLQTNDIVLPRGIKRLPDIDKTERFSIVKLSWWFNHYLNKEDINGLLKIIERQIPEILPKRYGFCEPPKEKFTSLEAFEAFFAENIHNNMIWYPHKPVESVYITVPDPIGPGPIGYRFGYLSISIDAAVLSMAGWETEIIRLFKRISEMIKPFYGDIFILNDYIRSRTVLCQDDMTQKHPIMGYWWNGIPRKSGLAVVFGEPLLKYIKISRDYESLDNGCKLFQKNKDDKKDELYRGLKIPVGLYQPHAFYHKIFNMGGFSGIYPRIWPFEGPKLK
ncbi:MAG: hypothetical protein WAP29_05410 [Halanaerobiales bacterium]|jgi:hypothetical protein